MDIQGSLRICGALLQKYLVSLRICKTPLQIYSDVLVCVPLLLYSICAIVASFLHMQLWAGFRV